MHIAPKPNPPRDVELLCITLMKSDFKKILRIDSFNEIIYKHNLEVRWKNITQDIEEKNKGKLKESSELYKEAFTEFINNLYQSEIYLNQKDKLLPFLDEVLRLHLKDLSFTSNILEELKQRLQTLGYDENVIKKMQIFNKIHSEIRLAADLPLQEYLKQDESKFLEFKSSMLFDKAKNEKSTNNFLSLAIIKSIASFLNTEGGNFC